MCLLPKITKDGGRIFYFQFKPVTDETNFDYLLFVKVMFALHDMQLNMEPMYCNIAIYDLKHMQWNDFLKFTPTLTQKMVECSLVSFKIILLPNDMHINTV